MKYSVKINSVKSIDELADSWSDADFIELLKRFGYADAEAVKQNELKDFLFMAITDFEPSDAAALILDYKLSEVLNKGQIDNLSHEMLREKLAENYSDIYIHRILFSINQLLYKAYNGKFPSTKATVVAFEMKPEHEDETVVTKELTLKAIHSGLSGDNLINRLFDDQLEGKAPFPEAEGIIWNLLDKGDSQYQLTTSEKWMNNEDFETPEFECIVTPFIEKSEDSS